MAKLTRSGQTVTTPASWEASYTIAAAGDKKFHFETAAKFVDQDIDLKVTTPSSSYAFGTSSTQNAKANAAIANTNSMVTYEESEISGKTAGTDYWQVKATTSGSTAGSYTAAYNQNTNGAGWISGNKIDSARSVGVTEDTGGKSIYVKAATTGTSNTGTKVGSTITLTNSTQYVSIGEGYTKAKYWQIPALSSANAAAPEAVSSIPSGATDSAGGENIILASGGALKIPAGYRESDLYFSLAGLIPDTYEGKTLATTGSMRSGYFAWDKDGNAILGNMANLGNPSSTYFVTSSGTAAGTGIAGSKITSGKYVNSDLYIKRGAASVNGSQNISVSGGTPTKNSTTSKYDISLSGSATINGTVTAGWVDAGTISNTVTASGTVSLAEATFKSDNTDADLANVNLVSTDGTAAGVNISAIVGSQATSEPTSGYYLAFTGEGKSKINTAGYISAGTVGNKNTSGTKYYPITKAVVSGNKVTTAGYLPKDDTNLFSAAVYNVTNSAISTIVRDGDTVTANTPSDGTAWTITVPVKATGTAYAGVTTAGYATAGNNKTSSALSKTGSISLPLYEGAYTIS